MANVPSLIDMSDAEIERYLRWKPGLSSASTPANGGMLPLNLQRGHDTIDKMAEVYPTPLPSNLPDVEVLHDYEARVATADKARRTVETQLRDLQLRHKEMETTLAEERVRRRICQELLEEAAMLKSGPAIGPGPQGPASGPGRNVAAEPISQLGRECQAVDSSLHRPGRLDPAEATVPAESTALLQPTATATLATPITATLAPPRRVAATLKLGSYNDTTPLDTFLAKVNNCREYYEWSEKDTVHHLRASLEDSAAQVLLDCGNSHVSLESIISLLQIRFGDQNQTERFRSELSTRHRAKGESL